MYDDVGLQWPIGRRKKRKDRQACQQVRDGSRSGSRRRRRWLNRPSADGDRVPGVSRKSVWTRFSQFKEVRMRLFGRQFAGRLALLMGLVAINGAISLSARTPTCYRCTWCWNGEEQVSCCVEYPPNKENISVYEECTTFPGGCSVFPGVCEYIPPEGRD
jgi:hypothetical protein